MRTPLPRGLILVALLQFIPPLILPPETLRDVGPVFWVSMLVLFAILGFFLLRRHAWSRVATIFVQGFNILIRMLVGPGHALQGAKAGAPLDVWLLSTFALSIALSAIILYYVDLPDVQMLMQ